MKFANKNIMIAALAVSIFAACTPESNKKSLGTIPAGAFTVTPVANDGNRFVISNTTQGAFMSVWSATNGNSSRLPADTFVFGKKGSWDINLMAYTQGGSASAKQTVTVAADIPPTQLVDVYNMHAANASTAWQVLTMGPVATKVTFGANGVNFSNAGIAGSNAGIFRKISLKPTQREYTLKVFAQGQMIAAAGDSAWLEAYIGKDAPLNNFNYTSNLIAGRNTKSACGTVALNGDFVSGACTGSGNTKPVNFTDATDYYIVIKAGSLLGNGSLGAAGISIDSIQLWQQIK